MVIGLDGGEWAVIHPLIERGILPNLERLIHEGSSGNLRSTIPPITPTAWASFLTGVNPGKHSIFSYQKKSKEDSYQVSPLNSLDIKSEHLWHTIGRHGKRVNFVNVPMSFPPQPVNGNMITGMMTPSTESRFTSPESIREELLDAGIQYRIDLRIHKEINQIEDASFRDYYFGNQASNFFDDLYDLTKNRYKAIDYLMENKPWDFFMTVFIGMDRIQHFLWENLESGLKEKDKIADKIFDFYHYLDDAVGKIVSKAGEETTIIIMSDHGFGKYKGDLLVNKFLMDHGFLKIKKQNQRFIPLLKKIALKIGLRKERLSKIFNSSKVDTLRMGLQQVDWARSRAYCALSHGIHINLKDRESLGLVEPGSEYEELRDFLIQKLYELTDPITGGAVIKNVYKKEEIYTGSRLDMAPDLVLLSSDVDHYGIYSTQYYKESVFKENRWKTGDHRQSGIFITRGPNIKNNHLIEGAEIIDLFPTILFHLGLPIPEHVDGKVLMDIYETPIGKITYEKTGPATEQEKSYDYTEDEKESVRERLKQLGYID
jgi:predicted AlkP superfamily phosphohydrolase/phosphomutase